GGRRVAQALISEVGVGCLSSSTTASPSSWIARSSAESQHANAVRQPSFAAAFCSQLSLPPLKEDDYIFNTGTEKARTSHIHTHTHTHKQIYNTHTHKCTHTHTL